MFVFCWTVCTVGYIFLFRRDQIFVLVSYPWYFMKLYIHYHDLNKNFSRLQLNGRFYELNFEDQLDYHYICILWQDFKDKFLKWQWNPLNSEIYCPTLYGNALCLYEAITESCKCVLLYPSLISYVCLSKRLLILGRMCACFLIS